jgi:hypothetical protein
MSGVSFALSEQQFEFRKAGENVFFLDAFCVSLFQSLFFLDAFCICAFAFAVCA